jgi:cell division septation protein DedD
MDRQLLERLIGAGVLVVALVIIVPAILDGDSDDDSDADVDHGSAVSTTASEPRRTHTIRLDQSTQRPPVAREVAEPAAASSSATGSVTGNGGGREATKSPTASSPKPVTTVAATPPAVKPVTVTPAPPKQPRVPDPISAEPVSVPKAGWVVQLGSFSSKQNARQLADEVGGQGFPAFLTELDRSGKTLYRVRVGPRDTRAQATELAGRLKKAGYSGQVMQ